MLYGRQAIYRYTPRLTINLRHDYAGRVLECSGFVTGVVYVGGHVDGRDGHQRSGSGSGDAPRLRHGAREQRIRGFEEGLLQYMSRAGINSAQPTSTTSVASELFPGWAGSR